MSGKNDRTAGGAKPRKLTVKRETIRDLDLTGKNAKDVKGGSSKIKVPVDDGSGRGCLAYC